MFFALKVKNKTFIQLSICIGMIYRISNETFETFHKLNLFLQIQSALSVTLSIYGGE